MCAPAPIRCDDVQATRALRDWLVEQRPQGTPWRANVLEPISDIPELDEQVARLHASGPETPEHPQGRFNERRTGETNRLAADFIAHHADFLSATESFRVPRRTTTHGCTSGQNGFTPSRSVARCRI